MKKSKKTTGTSKKEIRSNFRISVFSRDGQRCRVCGATPTGIGDDKLDAHHITDRHEIHNGGYVLENGISLCPRCHLLAEESHRGGVPLDGYTPSDLYFLVKSSYDLAVKASLRS